MDDILAQTLLVFAAILVGARLVGALAVRLHQPRIGGEMLAGLVVGAVLFSPWRTGASGSHHAAVVGLPVVRFVDVLGQIGVILYLCLVGLTLTPLDLRRNRRSIAAVSLPVVLGSIVLAPPAANWFEGGRWQLVGGASAMLVMAAALMINGFPVVARILQERNLLHGDFGATVLGASALLVTVPFLLVAAAKQRFHSADLHAAGYVLRLLAVAAVGTAAAVVWPAVSARIRPIARAGGTAAASAVIATLAVAWLSLKLLGTGLLGGFLVGVALSQSAATRSAVERALGAVVPAVLLPVFLAAAGARVDLRAIDPTVIEGAAIFTVLLVAVAALAGWAGSRAERLAGDAMAIAALVNCRGLVLLALAIEMADQHLIGPRLVAVFFLGAVGTTLMTGPLLAYADRLARRAARQNGAQPPSWSLPEGANTGSVPGKPSSPSGS